MSPMVEQPEGYDPKLDPIELLDYDPSWPTLYAREEAALRDALKGIPGILIDHCGSTAVPGLPAKPIIDILLRTESRVTWPSLIAPIESLGYLFWASNPDKETLYFVKGLPPLAKRRTHHVHVYDKERTGELLFRDILRREREVAEAYLALKRELAERFRFDRKAYTDSKGDFIQGVLKRFSAS
jgi:GrpB-like predicted nucleotidyltransferase (UPF0157 family)